MAEAKTKRNREIYEARLRGETFAALGKKYGVTKGCINGIIQREIKKEELKKQRVYQVMMTLTDKEELLTKAMGVLKRNHLDSKEALLTLTKKELLECNNCGEVTANLILQAADIFREEG